MIVCSINLTQSNLIKDLAHKQRIMNNLSVSFLSIEIYLSLFIQICSCVANAYYDCVCKCFVCANCRLVKVQNLGEKIL